MFRACAETCQNGYDWKVTEVIIVFKKALEADCRFPALLFISHPENSFPAAHPTGLYERRQRLYLVDTKKTSH
jgi:hypothetical protein